MGTRHANYQYRAYFMLYDVMEQLCAIHSKPLQRNGVTMQLKGEECLAINGSVGRFLSAMNLLIARLIEALDGCDRAIVVRARKEPGGFTLLLEGSAQGVDVALLDRLFEPLEADQTVWAKNILEREFNATIAVKSDRYGTGFIVEFDD